MLQYDVYIGYEPGPDVADAFTELGGYALGRGLRGFATFDMTSGWNAADGPHYGPIKMFRFFVAPSSSAPESIRTFVKKANDTFPPHNVGVIVTKVVDPWGAWS